MNGDWSSDWRFSNKILQTFGRASISHRDSKTTWPVRQYWTLERTRGIISVSLFICLLTICIHLHKPFWTSEHIPNKQLIDCHTCLFLLIRGKNVCFFVDFIYLRLIYVFKITIYVNWLEDQFPSWLNYIIINLWENIDLNKIKKIRFGL